MKKQIGSMVNKQFPIPVMLCLIKIRGYYLKAFAD
jgi:hypothetical protein